MWLDLLVLLHFPSSTAAGDHLTLNLRQRTLLTPLQNCLYCRLWLVPGWNDLLRRESEYASTSRF